MEGRCLAYSRGEAYRPVADMLRLNFDILQDEKDDQVRDKVKRG